MRYSDRNSTDVAPLLDDRVNAQTNSVASNVQATHQVKSTLKRKKYLVALVILGTCASFLGILHYISNTPQFNQYRIIRDYQNSLDTKQRHCDRPRTILFWNTLFGDKCWYMHNDTVGPDFFRYNLHCYEYRCDMTNNRDFLPAIEMFDAVLFHTAQPFPFPQSVPPRRSPHQQYVFALMESPAETKHELSDEGGFYNLTMTYRLDSDLLWPYDRMEDIQTGEIVAPAIQVKWRQAPAVWNDTAVWNMWEGKTRMAAWFVSHCNTISKREKMVAALQKHIDVDIYGACGNYSCPRSSSSKCDELLDERYKFYFSFENSLCVDYVTEKLYNAMRRNVIPVVFGGADYTRFVPPHSIIDAEDFQNVAELASHLQYLDTHPKEYLRYFWWRRYYRFGHRSPYCDLCAKLHSATYAQKTQTYVNIEKWWMGDQCRFESKIEF